MKFSSRVALSCAVTAIGLCLGSCAANSDEAYVNTKFETLALDGYALDGKHVAVFGCVLASPHAMVLIDCNAASALIPLESPDSSSRSGYSRLYEMALRSQMGSQPPPRAYVCGVFHMAPKANGRWIDVLWMSSSGFPVECNPRKAR